MKHFSRRWKLGYPEIKYALMKPKISELCLSSCELDCYENQTIHNYLDDMKKRGCLMAICNDAVASELMNVMCVIVDPCTIVACFTDVIDRQTDRQIDRFIKVLPFYRQNKITLLSTYICKNTITSDLWERNKNTYICIKSLYIGEHLLKYQGRSKTWLQNLVDALIALFCLFDKIG